MTQQINRLLACKKDHRSQLMNLELVIETQPRESKFSPNLMNLIQKEELLSRDPSIVSPPTDLLQNLEEALSNETHKFFSKSSSINIKRWNSLDIKVSKERERLRYELLGNKLKYSNTATTATNAATATGIITTETPKVSSSWLEEEEARLVDDYNKNWYNYEGFNLIEAFKSQAAKVDSDWSVYEENMREEYRNRKKAILRAHNLPDTSALSFNNHSSNGSKSPTSPTLSPDSPSKWQHPEKQKTLIHTAPVLSPTRYDDDKSSFSGRKPNNKSNHREHSNGNFVDNSVAAMELDKLDRQYHNSYASLAKQKGNASRWMHRQKIRLIAQAEESVAEKNVYAEIVSRHEAEYRAMLSEIQ